MAPSPLDEPGVYVAAAYLVFVALVVIYVVVITARLSRTRSQLVELAERAPRDDRR
jgi:hypothetical protein